VRKATRRAAAVLLAAVFFAPAVSADEAFVQKIRRVSPGTAQERVLRELGEPEAVVDQRVDYYGRRVEVWRYLPGIAIPAQATLDVSTDVGSASLSFPSSTTVPGNTADRLRQDMRAWERVQKASFSNPSDPFYRPVRSADPPSAERPAITTLPVYFVTFSDGIVQHIGYSEERLS